MLPFLQFLIVLALIISAAKLGGLISVRLGQPAVAGEVLAGLLLGPTALDMLHWGIFTDIHLIEETITFLAELGVLMLMFIAGLELHISDLAQSGRASVIAGVMGFLAPLGMGYFVADWLGFAPAEALFIGLLLAPTSVSISAQTLMELRVLRSRAGVSLLGAAVIDDILVVLGVSVFLTVLGGSGADQLAAGGVFLIVLRMVLYLAGAMLIGYFIIPRVINWVERMPVSQNVVAFTFVTMIVYAWSAEYLGSMATIIGAFLAGLFFGRTELKGQIEQGFSSIAYGVFVPVFFVSVGLEANFRELDASSLPLLVALLLTAILSKIIGSGLGGLLARFPLRESLQLGFSMVPRGEVVLIVATVGITEGFITQTELSIAVIMVVLTTLLTPPILRLLFPKPPLPGEPQVLQAQEIN
ncbi:MAG: cation:proton antiporter [Chloroflexi bacterium]|nr:MAG: cation:proton antiporter [Chloroflexota bacterium]MBL1196171.1 cation:proton antiporter [Chloroflexota bacterium]NOH13464.1 cation:proton antiporter [Chloroflexota bacterium]